MAELFVDFYELNEFQIRKHLIMSDSSMLKKNSISFSETKNDYLELYLHIGRRPHRIFMVSYEFNELFMLNDGKYQGKCSLSHSLLLSLHVLLRLIHTEGNWKRTVGVSRGYTDHHQGRAIHMADSRIH